ncbi:MAG: hypothetical protein HFI81_04645 [Eubacterium sp.]|jgi:hypothetical protein|nr:hypothetical protein [Eubacterium sp.]
MNEAKKQRQQEQIEMTKRQIARKEEILCKYPEIGEFVRSKERCMRILLLLGLVCYIFRAVVVGTLVGASAGAQVFGFFMGFGFYCVLLLGCMSHTVKAQGASVIICVCILASAVIKNIKLFIASGNIIALYQEAFQIQPMATAADLSTLFYMLLVCIAVVWAVLLPKNHKKAKRYEELMGMPGQAVG